MVKRKALLFPGGDTSEQQKSPLASTEEQSQERTYGSDNMVMERDSVESDVNDQNSEGYFKILDQIQEKASSSALKILLQCDDVIDSLDKEEERLRLVEEREKRTSLTEESFSRRLRELEEKDIEFDLRLVTEATFRRLVLEKQSEEVLTQLKTHESKKLCELDKAEKDFDLKQRLEIERRNEEYEAREKELRSLEEAIKEKTAELKIKEETFELKLKEEAGKWREENEVKRKGLEIMEKTLEKRFKELELKQTELERSIQQFMEGETRKRSTLELESPLLVENDSDDAASLTHLAKKHKSHEANDGLVCTDESDEDPYDFSKLMSSFAVNQVWALYDPRDDMPRIYAQVRSIFDSQMSLQVTLLEHVKTTKDEKSILSACGISEYGDTEIKSHLMFAHEMDHITCDNYIIVNPRKGETWALFRDWDITWNSHTDLHEPPYRYDFVEVITEFDDLHGIGVAYIGRVEGFASVFNPAAQGGIIKMMISPHEMQRFSHKVESVKLRGEEEEGIPASYFVLNPAATPSYDPALEEALEMKIQSKDCGKAPIVEYQKGSTKDLPIIID